MSRAELARVSGVSKPTVSQALAALERAALVREAGRTSGSKGPAAVLYEVNPAAGHVVGVDVGHERVRAAVADLSGRTLARVDQKSRAQSARALITQIGKVARQVADQAGLPWSRVTVTVVGSPGVFSEDGDHPALAHNLPGWGRAGVLDAVRAELGTHVRFDNDVNLAALGESRFGAARGVETFVYLHVGTGVGMGILLDGQLYRGATGAAGEVGYLPLGPGDPFDPTNRRRGALESAIGGQAVVRDARAAGLRGVATASEVLRRAREGDDRAQAVVRALAQRIALAVASIALVLDPALIVLGGGIGRNGELLLEPVRRALATLSPIRPRVDVSELGVDAELLGAVAMGLVVAQEQLFHRSSEKDRMAV
jgi:predicted NBD/HSP70 family sugar kinase